jgi:hypothetical protein
MQNFNQEAIDELADKKLATIAAELDARIKQLENAYNSLLATMKLEAAPTNAKLATTVSLLVREIEKMQGRIRNLEPKHIVYK